MSERNFNKQFAVFDFVEGSIKLHQLSLREIVAKSKNSPPPLWSGRLSTGVFGNSRCEIGNKGPTDSSQVIVGIGNIGLKALISTGFTPCPDCKPEETPGFWQTTKETIQKRWGLYSKEEFADKTKVSYDSRRLPWEDIFTVIGKLPDRVYLPKSLTAEEFQEFKNRLLSLSDQIPDLGYFDFSSPQTGYFTPFP